MIIIDTLDYYEIAENIFLSFDRKVDEETILELSEKLSDSIPAYSVNEILNCLEFKNLSKLKEILIENDICI